MLRRIDVAFWASALLSGVVAFGAAALVQHVGESARVYGAAQSTIDEPVRSLEVVETARGVHASLAGSGLRGRVLIYLSRYLHFVPVEGAVPDGLSSFPIPRIDLVEVHAEDANPRNLLWVVLQGGIAREIVHLLPEGEYKRRRGEISTPSPGIDLQPTAIVTSELGSRRTILADLPILTETVILGIDAAYFDEADVDSTLTRLRRSEMRTDFVVLNLALDNPDVSDVGRVRLVELAEVLEGAR
jgi:hypothetical protein